MTPAPTVATCTECQVPIHIPEDAKPGHKIVCTHCGAAYRAWQLLARAYRRDAKGEEK